jgi:hypothetical protein
MISTTEHREPDLQTKIAIYPGVQVCLRDYTGLEITTLSCELQNEYGELITMQIPQPARHWIRAFNIIIFGNTIHHVQFV